MNILVTGGAGYIGTELVYALEQEAGIDQIVVYDNLSRSNYNLLIGRSKLHANKVRFVRGDLLDSHKLKKEVATADIVYHLAAKVTTPFADHNPHEFDQINNWGTAELTYLVEKSNVAKFIYTSSVSVYGASSDELDINSPLNPKTFYGISKMHAEEYVNRLSGSDIEVLILRLGNVYGYSKSMRFDSVINKFIFEANFTNRLRIYGDGNQMRSFIQIDRLSKLLKHLSFKGLKAGIYNVVENTYSVNDVVTELDRLYPSLEKVFVNQNMQMRTMNVKRDVRMQLLMQPADKSLGSDLQEFKTHFSF